VAWVRSRLLGHVGAPVLLRGLGLPANAQNGFGISVPGGAERARLSVLTGRSANHAAEIAAPEGPGPCPQEQSAFTLPNVVSGLVFDAVVECLDDVFLELLRARNARARTASSSRFAVLRHRSAPAHPSSTPAVTRATTGCMCCGNARRRVQSDRRPDRIDVVLVNAVTAEEVAGSVRAVDLESLRGRCCAQRVRPMS